MTNLEQLDRKVYCARCQQETNHYILRDYSESSNTYDDFQWESNYYIVKCAGCDKPAFVENYGDEDMWDYSARTGKREWCEEYKVYPEKPIAEPIVFKYASLEIKDIEHVPNRVNDVYKQLIQAYNNGYLLLATIGIRTLIEAICLDVGIKKGKEYTAPNDPVITKKNSYRYLNNLYGKIFGLFENHMITWNQTMILQSIRDIGNDAVHEIKEPNINDFRDAVQIVEHLMIDVYALKKHRLLKIKRENK